MSNFLLHVEPGTKPLSREEFCSSSPKFSVALDGYVCEGPWFIPEGPFQNFNHHEGVSRLETRATCAQVSMAIQMGLFRTFQKDGKPFVHVFVNDCDEDVCLSWWLIKNHDRFPNPLINRIVGANDLLDTTGGLYPFPQHSRILAEVAWIFDPYRRFRFSGRLSARDCSEFTGVINDVCHRLDRYLMGAAETLPLKTGYEILGGGKGWKLLTEEGHARTQIAADGIQAFVSVRTNQDGSFTYTLARISEWIPFPLDKLYSQLNDLEGCQEDRWGGSSIIGGSPRINGSKLSPKDLELIINKVLDGRI